MSDIASGDRSTPFFSMGRLSSSFVNTLEIEDTCKADHFIAQVKRLPPAPSLAVELLGLFGSPDRDLDRIVELITHDPVLTVEVLKRCNSSFAGGSEPASDMFEAVTRLGLYEVYCVVVGLMGAKAMDFGKQSPQVNSGDLWRHSVVTAVAASILAKRAHLPAAEAFTAGLLHDIGKLVFGSVAADEHCQIRGQGHSFGRELAMAEQAVLGVDHAHVGARLLEKWGLPESLTDAVRHHHADVENLATLAPMASLIFCADALAHHALDQTPLDRDFFLRALDEPNLLGQEDDAAALVAKIQEGVQRVQTLLRLRM